MANASPPAALAGEPFVPRSVVVVGGGVVGLSCALWAQRAGHRVTLVEKNPPLPGIDYSGAASYGNAATIALSACLPLASPGIARQVPGMLMDRRGPLSIFWRDLPDLLPWLLRFLSASTPAEVDRITSCLGALMRLAEEGHAPLMEESGVKGIKRALGCMHLFRSERSIQAALPAIRRRQREGVKLAVLGIDEIREREPNLAPLYAGGIFFPECYSIDTPELYARGLLRAFLARSGTLVRGEASDVLRDADTVSVAVDGALVSAERLVIAAGAWSERLAGRLGERTGLGVERGYHVVFRGGETLLTTPTLYPEDGFYMTPLSGGLRSAGTIELGGFGRPLRPARCEVIARKTRAFLPGLGQHDAEWLGYRPSMPDSLPVIGPSPTDPRVIYAFGHGHVGLTLAGVTGRLVAELLAGRPPSLDIAPLRPDRFRMRPAPRPTGSPS